MDFRTTPEWCVTLRKDLKAWDLRVEEGRNSHFENVRARWTWPDMRPSLRYADSKAEVGPGGRRRRASTSMTLGTDTGRNPPSAVYSWHCGRHVAMHMRLPVHLWATLSHGREAESDIVEVGQAQIRLFEDSGKGIGCRERWREHDWEQGWRWELEGGAWRRMEWSVRRMEWTRMGGVWVGQWKWGVYDRLKEWDEINHKRHEAQNRSLSTSYAEWGSVPQEVLLRVVHFMCIAVASDWERQALTGVGWVCRAWLTMCAPKLYRRIFARSSRIRELIQDLSQPCSRIAQHARRLRIQGPVPWLVLTKLLLLLPHIGELEMVGDWGTSQPEYHHMAPRLSLGIRMASQYMSSITSLTLMTQSFSSADDVLRLLAQFPLLSSVGLDGCTIQTPSANVSLVSSTHLTDMAVWRGGGVVCDKTVASLARWWQWPHAGIDEAVGPYPALHPADAREIFAVLGSILPAVILQWSRVNLSLEKSWSTSTWVLSATMEFSNDASSDKDLLKLEFHVTCRWPEVLARVNHIVIRLSTFRFVVQGDTYCIALAAMEDPMMRLPNLRTVTLETIKASESEYLIRSLEHLRASGMVRLRTCEEAQELALAAQQNPRGYSEDQGVRSPLWYSDKYSRKERQEWFSPYDVPDDSYG